MFASIDRKLRQALAWIPDPIFYFYFPIALSIELGVCTFLFVYTNRDRVDFQDSRTGLIAVSGIFSGIIITYLVSKVLQIRQENLASQPEHDKLTQQVHQFRRVIGRLVHAEIWPNGLKKFVEIKYKGLSHAEVSQIRIVDAVTTERANAFIRDRTFGDIKYLYLELKALLSEDKFDIELFSDLYSFQRFSLRQLQSWLLHEAGSSLFYYFDHKWAVAKRSIFLNNLNQQDQESILRLAVKIDAERFGGAVFDNQLIGSLGTYFTQELLPRLYVLQRKLERGLPSLVRYLISLLGLLTLFGIIIPIFSETYTLPKVVDITSFTMVITVTFYITISFFQQLKKETNIWEK